MFGVEGGCEIEVIMWGFVCEYGWGGMERGNGLGLKVVGREIVEDEI